MADETAEIDSNEDGVFIEFKVSKESIDSAKSENASLTKEMIDNLDDVIEAMCLAEEQDVSTEALETIEDIQLRLKCHMNLQSIGNLKLKVKQHNVPFNDISI